ncbi:MAG TPA: hypothetical protein G4N91_00580 [Dehalococcoidia bacterium]|nr:hypothetical protein [Dehalococcoidia bacterium]
MKRTWGMVSFALFILALVLAFVGGIVEPSHTTITAVLAGAGVVIGVIYAVSAKEINILLLATIALLAAAAAFVPITDLWEGDIITGIIQNFAALMAPVALIAAIYALLKLGWQKE